MREITQGSHNISKWKQIVLNDMVHKVRNERDHTRFTRMLYSLKHGPFAFAFAMAFLFFSSSSFSSLMERASAATLSNSFFFSLFFFLLPPC
jgi:hypothetical protein